MIDRRATLAAIVRLTTPAIAQSLLHSLVLLVDLSMLGHYSADALASMQISGPVTWALFSTVTAFAVGAIALVGRSVGAGDAVTARAATRASLWFAGAAGAIAGGLVLVGLDLLLALFPEAGAGVRAEARGYLTMVLPGMVFFVVSLTAADVLAAGGDTRTPFLVSAFGNVVNVGGNWILIFGHFGAPALGAMGAGVSSVLAMVAQCALLLWILSGRDRVVTWRGRGGEVAALRRILRVALPAVGERVVQHTGTFGFVLMIGSLGGAAMAANQAIIGIESVAFLSADGFGIAAAAVVAQRLGAGRPDEAAYAGRMTAQLAGGLLLLVSLAFVLIPEVLLRAFTDDAAVIATGAPCLYVAAVAQPFMGIGIVLAQSLRGAGATRSVFLTMILGGLVVRLSTTYLFVFVFELGLVGAWIGSTLDWLVRVTLLTVLFARSHWRVVTV